MDILAPDVTRIAPGDGRPAEDRVPDGLAAGTPEPLRSELIDLLGADRVLTRVIDLVRYSRVLTYGRRSGVPVTLRAGGTSLSGQAQTLGASGAERGRRR